MRHYDHHISPNHLDVGVGTGYFLDHCRFETPSPRMGLIDPNSPSLDAAGRRLARYAPEIHQADILEPIPVDQPRSIPWA